MKMLPCVVHSIGFDTIMTCSHHVLIIRNHLAALTMCWASPLHPSHPPLSSPGPGIHQAFYCFTVLQKVHFLLFTKEYVASKLTGMFLPRGASFFFNSAKSQSLKSNPLQGLSWGHFCVSYLLCLCLSYTLFLVSVTFCSPFSHCSIPSLLWGIFYGGAIPENFLQGQNVRRLCDCTVASSFPWPSST